MKISIPPEGTLDSQVKMTEDRDAAPSETEATPTLAAALADAMFEVMDQLGE